jgi:hypothetical protein
MLRDAINPSVSSSINLFVAPLMYSYDVMQLTQLSLGQNKASADQSMG